RIPSADSRHVCRSRIGFPTVVFLFRVTFCVGVGCARISAAFAGARLLGARCPCFGWADRPTALTTAKRIPPAGTFRTAYLGPPSLRICRYRTFAREG